MRDTEIRVRELLAESGLDGEGIEEVFDALVDLERYVAQMPPEPSPELASVMTALARDVVRLPFARRRSRMFLAGAVAIGTVGAGGIAAAANELPTPAQTIVAEFSERYLPFALPRPANDPSPPPDEADPVQGATTTGDSDDDGADGAPSASTGGPAPVKEESSRAPSSTASPQASASPSPTAAPAPSAVPSPTTAAPGGDATDGGPEAAGTATASPSGEGAPTTEVGAAPTTGPTTGPTASASPSPTTNTRNEATDEPSPTASSSAGPSGSAKPSPGPSPSAGWSDAP